MNFYQTLPSFRDFSEITEDRHYATVPADWWIVVADIRRSTEAVTSGRYRDVNTLGAAAIAVAHNLLGEGTFPFVFGGDGATLVIPPDAIDRVKQQLCALRALARDQFQLTLRVGAVPVADLQDTRVDVAKLNIAADRCLAVFRGGGLSQAEAWVKATDSHYPFSDHPLRPDADLDGLSCRWLPITPSRGHALALIVRARSDNRIYRRVLDHIADLYGGQLEATNPVHPGGARYRTIRQCIEDEWRYHRSRWSLKFAWRLIEITCAVMIFRHGSPAPFDARAYARAIGRHSDYRKFDDMLRMVIDCSTTQADAIRSMLESLRADGHLDFGMHLSDESLMTCFFSGGNDGEHIHFIDGSDGGYVMAARELKQQLACR